MEAIWLTRRRSAEIVPLKYVFRIVQGGTPTNDPENWGGEVTWITPQDLSQAGSTISSSERTLSPKGLIAAATLVPERSLVLSTRAPIGYVAVAGCALSTNQGCRALVPVDEVDERFFYYQLLAARRTLEALGVGSTFRELPTDVLGDVRLVVPPIDVQRRIAKSLDKETGRIGELIEKNGRLLRLLDEKRAAVVETGIAGGFTSRDRGARSAPIPWLPRIPESWRYSPLKYVAILGTGHTPSRQHPEWWENCNIPWITTSDVHKFRDDRLEVLESTEYSISRLGLLNSSAVLHPRGTVALSRTASVGFSVVMGRAMATSQDFVTWTCSDRVLPEFLLYCLRAMRRDLLGRLAQGSTHKTIYMPDIESLVIPVPPVREQAGIVAEVRERLQPIDKLIDAINKQVVLLTEYRDAQILASTTQIPDAVAA